MGTGAPEMNPLVNPGAIATTSMVKGATADDGLGEDHRLPQRCGRPPLTVIQDVYKSESETNQRNQAIGALMFAYGYIKSEPAAGGRSLHAAVLDRRQREGPRDDGGDAGQLAARIPSRASR